MDNIQIDYTRDRLIPDNAQQLLKERYYWKDEKSPQECFRRASIFGATYKGNTDWDLANRLYDYCSNLWFMYSTPILSNGGTTRGYPISCFLNYVDDSRSGISDHYDENIWLASGGGGIGSYWGDLRSDGTDTSNGSKSTGCIPFMHVVDSQMLAFNQGTNRRGACATYMDINHPEIEEFIDMRKTTGGDPHRRNTNLHHGVCISNSFISKVESDETFDLVDPHTNSTSKTVKARDLWFKLLETRVETGEPYLINIDTINEGLPEPMREKGLKVHHSNLCTEITLPTNENRTAVCCLSSVNLEKFDEWVDHPTFVQDLVRMLDNVLERFIEDGSHSSGMKRAVYSASQERSLGLGAMGFHSYLQKRKVPIESAIAVSLNNRVFKHIEEKSKEESRVLADERGEAPDMVGTGMRNAHLLAVAPNASSSIICGNTSPSIEPSRANVYTHKGVGGFTQIRNKYLVECIRNSYSVLDQEHEEEIWQSIFDNEGSVQHLDILNDYEKEIFKTAPEIDQRALVYLASSRQQYIDQAQSFNVFFTVPKGDADKSKHDMFLQYVSDVHLSALKNLKTMYYLRVNEASKVENVEVKIPDTSKSDDCFYCEG